MVVSSTTVYPYLSAIATALQTGLRLQWPVLNYANLETLTIQGTPQIAIVMEDTTVRETISKGRQIKTVRLDQIITVMTILRDASDQSVTDSLLVELGEWQANVLQVLCRDVLSVGGPLRILDLPKPEAVAGGAIAGRIRLGLQFAFEAE
jgi:hypothetical protein